MENNQEITPQEIESLQHSWAKVVALDETFVVQGTILFKNIFEIAPEALQLFSFKDEPDMFESPKFKKHASGVIKAVDGAMSKLGTDQKSTLNALGGRHVKRGVVPAHYAVVGQALIKTLETGLGEDFTAEL